MKHTTGKSLLLLSLLLLVSAALLAQNPSGAITGTINDEAGKPVPNAKVTAKSTGGQVSEAETDATGGYKLADLAAGEYEVTVSKPGFNSSAQHVTLAAGAAEKLDAKLSSVLSLEGLGFPSSATKGSTEQQARLDKRSHMLKMHQRLGLITTVPLVATLFTGNLAGGHETSSTGRNVHAILGSTTAGLYFTSAAYAMFAPKVPGTPTRGNIRMHKMLAWIHGPGMVLTPILGAMAYEQKSNGEKVHGIASAHVPVAAVTSIAYGAAIISVSLRSRRKSVRDTADQP